MRMARQVALPVAAMALLVGAAGLAAAPPPPSPRADAGTLAFALAETPAQHRQMAKDYRRQAASYGLDAQMHRLLRDTYREGVSATTRGRGNSWWSQARAHCDRMAAEAKRLSQEAEAMAALHEEQARAIEAGENAPRPLRRGR